jgi:predicted ATPase
LLLVLDNFEHLLAGTHYLNEILAHAPQITILVTSRERLNLQAEWLFDVEGLSYPAAGVPRSAAETANYSALQLFIQRAMQVQPSFALTEEALAAVAHICQHVAGMPLAIELAAANVRLLPVTEIEKQIHTSLDALATTMRDVPARHRSMRAVFDYSWSRLSEAERELFSRLAVFRGGCMVDAVEQVCESGLPGLINLTHKSLLRQDSLPNTDSRFVMLEPLREYALEKLVARKESAIIQRAHALYYLALAEGVAAQWETSSPPIEALDQEYDNLRAVLQWASGSGDVAVGFHLCVALRKYWQRRGL